MAVIIISSIIIYTGDDCNYNLYLSCITPLNKSKSLLFSQNTKVYRKVIIPGGSSTTIGLITL